MFPRLAFAAVLASSLVGHGWAQTPPPPSRGSQIGKPASEKPKNGPCDIGVIPIAGDLFLVQKFGVDRVAADGWGLDELVVSRVRAAAPGRSVHRIPFTPTELRYGARRQTSSLFGDRLTEFAQHVGARISCKRYVVVHRHGGSSREFGIGISKRLLYEKPILFAMMKIVVYDGRTFDVIRQAPASIKDDNSFGRTLMGLPGGPILELDPSAFPDKPADAARNPVLRDGVRALLTQSLDNTLPAMLR